MPEVIVLAKSTVKRPINWFRKTSKKKKILTIAALVIFLLIVLPSIFRKGSTEGYTMAKVEKSDIVAIVTESGNVTSGNNSPIYSPTNGIIDSISVQNGDSVTEGQELFVVKSTASEQEKQAAYATYLTAKATLDAAKSNLNVLRSDMYAKWKTYQDMATNSTYENEDGSPDTQQRLAAEFQIVQDNWVAAEAKYKDQQTAINQAQAQVNSSWLLYQATQNATVTAPVDGTVANLSVSVGNTVEAKSLTVSTTPVLSLSDFGVIEVMLSLNELDVVKVKPGQEVTIDVNAVDDKVYKGRISRVDSIGTNIQGVMQYKTFVTITNPDGRLKSGLSADADIVTEKVQDVLSVPNAAVKPYKGGRAVRILDPKSNKLIYKPVEIGVRGKDRTEILSGIEEGQQVIVALPNDQIKRQSLF